MSSIFWKKGNSHRAVELALDKKVEIFTSAEILRELEIVLRRDFSETEEMVQRQIGLIIECANIIAVNHKIDVVRADPDDNKIVKAKEFVEIINL